MFADYICVMMTNLCQFSELTLCK